MRELTRSFNLTAKPTRRSQVDHLVLRGGVGAWRLRTRVDVVQSAGIHWEVLLNALTNTQFQPDSETHPTLTS